jgi:MFS family permease
VFSAAALRPFRHRNFVLLWSAGLVSNIGTWMEIVAVGSLLARDTARARDLGILAAAGFLPTAVFAPIGGAISDRVPRKAFLLITLGFDTALAIVLAALLATGSWTPGLLWAIVFVEGCSGALSLPNRQALMPELVPPEDLSAAVGLGSISWNGGRVIGPLLAGVVIAVFSTTWAVVINAVSFVLMLIAVIFITLPKRPTSPSTGGLVRQLTDAARHVRRSAPSRFAVLAIVGLALSAGPFIGLLPIVAHNVFKGGAAMTSVFVTAQGLGAIVGALTVPKMSARWGRERALLFGFAVLAPAITLYAVAPHPAVAAAALVAIGGGYFCVLVSGQAILQMDAPTALRARVMALFSIALGLPYVIAVTAHGFIGDAWGLRQTHLIMAAATAIMALALGSRTIARAPHQSVA